MGVMELDIYKKAIDDLSEFNTNIKTLKLYKDGEPLVNKKFAEMVSYAKASHCVNIIETTTNGSLLTPQLTDKIIDAGLDRINISVYGMSTEDFHQFSRAKLDFDEFVNNIRYLYRNRGNCKVHIKTTFGISKRETIDEFYHTFGSYCDTIDVENISPFWPGYDFNPKYDLQLSDVSTFGHPLKEKLVCPYIFYALAVNSDGRVDLCSCDWTHNYIIGDVRKQSLKDIWNSRQLYDERVLQLSGQRMNHPLCSQCNEISYESVDNIDEYSEEILQRLKKTNNQ